MTARRRDLQQLVSLGVEAKEKGVVKLREAWSILSGLCEGVDKYAKVINSGFSEWLRRRPGLDSRHSGLSIHNLDWIIHQYKVTGDKNGPRTLNNLMLIEEKQFNAEPKFDQLDTLSVLDQLITRPGKDGLPRTKARAKVRNQRGEWVLCRYFGLHILQFSGVGPEDSEKIRWDGKVIEVDQLEKIIRFDLDAYSLAPRDTTERRHHANNSAQMPMYETGAG